MENGEDEEEDDLSEGSLSQSHQLHQTIQLRNKPTTPGGNQRPGSRAPTMTIDVVRVGRPLKILAFLLSVFSLLLFIVGSVSTSWIYIDYKSIGLYQQCDVPSVMKAPESNKQTGIVSVNTYNEIQRICQYRDFLNIETIGCILLDLTALLFNLLGCSLLLSGIFSLNLKHKRIFYYTSVILNTIACITMLLGVILLAITSTEDNNRDDKKLMSDGRGNTSTNTNQSIVTVGWSLIIVCCGIVILGIAVCLVLYDRGGEEIEYRETIHRSSNYIEEDA
ncbi:unnamed protein product [Trichobilharzia szidati]|nr:unnamed protein product [Trichobilharzia szidati]